jgi:hypothetical protein
MHVNYFTITVIGSVSEKFYQLSILEKGPERNHLSVLNDRNKKLIWSAKGGLVIVFCHL